MHLLAVALLAHPSGEQLFMLLDRMVRAMGSVPQSQTTMSAMLTMLATSAVFLFDGGCAVALLFILVCGVALLQSRLIKAAGHWTQHGASAIQLNNSRNMSRTCTSAAELFYLRHTRSCAATACGNKGGGTSHSIPLQMSGADFIARLLQSAAGIISPISETATEHRPNGAILCEDCDEADHSVLCHATGHAHMVHATGVGSVPPLGQWLHPSRPVYILL